MHAKSWVSKHYWTLGVYNGYPHLHLCLRSYTREFALQMTKVFPEVINTSASEEPAKLTKANASKQLEELWKSTPDLGDTWEDASLRQVAKYLIGAKGLKVPQNWEWIIPSHLWEHESIRKLKISVQLESFVSLARNINWHIACAWILVHLASPFEP